MLIKKICVVGGLHGNEPTGFEVVGLLHAKKQEGIQAIAGNIQAQKLNKRFIETDLNRSFNSQYPSSLEELRAQEIKIEIKPNTLLLDIHNTKAAQNSCVIITRKPDILAYSIAEYFGFSRLVQMPDIGALLSCFKEQGHALEISEHDMASFPANELTQKIIEMKDRGLPQVTQHSIQTYLYINSIRKGTANRLGFLEDKFENFKPLTQAQKRALHLDLAKTFVPMFKKKRFTAEAFLLLEDVTSATP